MAIFDRIKVVIVAAASLVLVRRGLMPRKASRGHGQIGLPARRHAGHGPDPAFQMYVTIIITVIALVVSASSST